MEIETTVDIDAEEVLQEMSVHDVIKYLIKCKDYEFSQEDIKDFLDYLESSTGVDFAKTLLEKLDPWDILYAIAAPLLPRNISDHQSIKDAIQEYLSRL